MWHNPFCLFEKYYNKPIICWTDDEKCITFNDVGNREHWKFLVNKYHIRYWMLQSEIVPNENNISDKF